MRDYLSSSEMRHLSEMGFMNKDKIKSITIPTLIIHGDKDEIIPVEEGSELYRNSGSRYKTIEIIPAAGHNDLMISGKNQYFDSIEVFIKNHS